MKKTILYIFCILGFLSMTSCNSDFLKEYSQSLARVQSVDDLEELLMGDCLLPKGYVNIVASSWKYSNPNYAVLHFMGDELKENVDIEREPNSLGSREDMFPYFTWQQNTYLDYKGKSSLESNESSYWTIAYTAINNCNMVMDAAEQFNCKSESDKQRCQVVEGETHFLRAFYYLTLANLYGKPYTPTTASQDLAVPIKTSPNVEDKEYTRATVAEVYDLIVSDLAQAENDLANVTKPASIYHVGLDAVYILRSRVALYMQDWQTASDYAQKAISLDGTLTNLVGADPSSYPIDKKNAEVIYSNGSSMFGNYIFEEPKRSSYTSYYAPVYCISDELYALYDDNDSRKTSYITTEDDVYGHKPTYHKIDFSKNALGYKDVSDVFSIRTAEAYLNKAEAEAQLGHDAEACAALTTLRSYRIDGAAQVNLSGAELISFVRDERERELCLEGHRWFDLRRYSVDAKYPYSKEIVHTMAYFQDRKISQVRKFKLEKNDAAYVLNLPKSVREFQPSIGGNERPVRNAFQTETNTPDEGDDDYDY